MRITVASDKLFEYLSLVGRVVSNKPSVPALENVLFEVQGGELRLTAGDGDTHIVTSMTLDGSGNSEGAFCIKAKTILDSIKEVPSQNLIIDLDPDTYLVNVRYATGNFELPARSGDYYPQAKPIQEAKSHEITMAVDVLMDGIEYSHYAAGVDESRPLTTGVHVDVAPEHITMVGTDGFVMAMYRNASITHDEAEGRYGFTLPRKVVALLRGLLQKESTDVVVSLTVYDNFAVVMTPRMMLQCRLLEGKYPNYESVIPVDNDKQMITDRMQLLTAVRRVSLFGNQAMDIVNLDISEQDLVIRASDREFNTRAEEHLPVSFTESETLKISFQASNLMNVLNAMDDDSVVVKLGDRARAAIITPEHAPEHVQITAAVMPMIF